jgi:hypothetical protein
MRPDYRRDVADVYLKAFCRMLDEASWDFICFLGDGFGSTLPGLPSWVRDFSTVVRVDVVASQQRRFWFKTIYRASLEVMGNIKIVNKTELHHCGYLVDRVTIVGPAEGTLSSIELLSRWLMLCRDTVGLVDEDLLRQTFCRIICGDVIKPPDGHSFRRASLEDLPRGLLFEEFMTETVTADPHGFGWGMNFSMKGRSFFITESGKMGLCSPNAQSGDDVWVLNGFLWPFVLRLQLSGENKFSMVSAGDNGW